jgi:hypothetical protein
MDKDLEEGVQELVRRWMERTQQSLKIAAQAEGLIRQCQNAKLELENGWLYLLITISVIGFIYIATTR